jgi:hypothetical protein
MKGGMGSGLGLTDLWIVASMDKPSTAGQAVVAMYPAPESVGAEESGEGCDGRGAGDDAASSRCSRYADTGPGPGTTTGTSSAWTPPPPPEEGW